MQQQTDIHAEVETFRRRIGIIIANTEGSPSRGKALVELKRIVDGIGSMIYHAQRRDWFAMAAEAKARGEEVERDSVNSRTKTRGEAI